MSALAKFFSLFTDLIELKRDYSAWALVAVNIVVAAGAIAFTWPVGQIVLIFWFESLIIGGLNVIRMLVAGYCAKDEMPAVKLAKTLFLTGFFIVHFGGFVAIHLLFIFVIFAAEPRQVWRARTPEDFLWGGGFSVLILLTSHLLSFQRNFLRGGEYQRLSLTALMLRPYGRVVIVHLYIFIAAALIKMTIAPLVAWFTLKILLDLVTHRWEHRQASYARRARLG